MSLSFPPADHPMAIDPAQVAEVLARRAELPSLPALKMRGLRGQPAMVKRVISLCILADDTLALVSIGRRGGHAIEWRFGKVGA